MLKQKSAEANPIETREEIAKLAGVSRDTVDKVKAIGKKATPDKKETRPRGKMTKTARPGSWGHGESLTSPACDFFR